MAIPIGTIGRIIRPELQAPFILVVEDLISTGGYLIMKSDNLQFSGDKVYDYWAPECDLEGFFEESGWQIDWNVNTGGSAQEVIARVQSDTAM